MNICMIGIDYKKADLDVRGFFSFTKKSAVSAMEKLCQLPRVQGCVILSTCNRTEIWLDTDAGDMELAWTVYKEWCTWKGIEEKQYRDVFVHREQQDAVKHLFWLTSGMKSRILGEDQILSQVKDALLLSRENGFVNNTLEVLFRLAVTAGKKVKTQVAFPHRNTSAVEKAVDLLRQCGYEIKNKHCMVIGNGQMGLLAARAFRDAGADVWMTVRAYRHGQVEVPEGCDKIPFETRAEYIDKCDYIVGATSSPHYVMTRNLFEHYGYRQGLVLIDLAVPRDVEESVREMDGIRLYDIDAFSAGIENEKEMQAIVDAELLLQEEMEAFYHWLDGRELVPRMELLKQEMAEDMIVRMQKKVRKLSASEHEKENLLENMEQAARKAVNKTLFGLKHYLTQDEFQRCLEGLEQLYGEE